MKKLNFFFEKNILKNIYIFLPVFLITGPFLPDLCVIIISLYFIFNINNFKNDQIFSKKFYWAFIIFYLAICISSFFHQIIVYIL